MYARVVLLAILLLCVAVQPAAATRKPWIGVGGNHLVNDAGLSIHLRGVNRSGSEYKCLDGSEVFEGPTDAASIEAIKSWHVNAVRVPLNESCWLGIEGIAPAVAGAVYRTAIRGYVERLEQAGLYVILDLQFGAPEGHIADSLLPMPDADHAPAFWRSVAGEYSDDRSVLFDLYNEPWPGVSWACWEWGCDVYAEGIGWYRATGMAQLLEAVRSTGAKQPVLLSGLEWARDLSGWLAHQPDDPASALVASNHTYRDLSVCYGKCRAVVEQVARVVPIVTAELGQIDCRHGYIDRYMRWADRHDVSYLAWAWDAEPGAPCDSGPSLIEDYAGSPSGFGLGFREHLRRLALPRLVFNDPIG